MKITNLKIENFKFHEKLELSINGNLLLYGENGTGKSSIYESLKSNLYISRAPTQDIQATFINRTKIHDTMKVEIQFDETNSINRIDNELENSDLLNNSTIYMLNEKTLNKVLNNKDFYQVIDTSLKYEFPKLKELLDIYNEFEIDIYRNMDESNKGEYISTRFDKDDAFELKFREFINEDNINNIIDNCFNEDFKMEFIINESSIDENNRLIRPTIRIKVQDIEDTNNLHNHFNEAKLKMISKSIYFSLAKSFEQDNAIKLLVLDDFLTSLDMANRKLIIQYILDEFADYQIIILTHNLQFNNMIKRILTMKDIEDNWDYKHLFLTKEVNGYVSNVIDKNINYLQDAQDQLNNGEYQITGNLIRKEFENIAEELKQVLELGKTESLNRIIELIKDRENKSFYFEPNIMIDTLQDKFTFLKNQLDGNSNLSAIKGICDSKIENIHQFFEENNNEEELKSLIEIIHKVEFYKNIAFNSSSHRDRDIAIYRKECERGISLLENLKSVLVGIKRLKQ